MKCPGSLVNYNNDELDTSLLPNDFGIFAKEWLRKADASYKKEKYFEGLIYLWVIFNSWLTLTIKVRNKSEYDRYLVESAACDGDLNACFKKLLKENFDFKGNVECFQKYFQFLKLERLKIKE